MGWEERNGSWYYYRKRREGSRVISEYVGPGLAGQFAELLDIEDREESEYKRAESRKDRAQAEAIDRQVELIERYTQGITRAYLLLAGYHAHKRQWRKLRNV